MEYHRAKFENNKKSNCDFFWGKENVVVIDMRDS